MRKGIQVGQRIHWLGLPIITREPGTTITIGNNTVVCSRSRDTALGVNHPVVLRTLRSGAILNIGDGVRMSGTTICAAISVEIGARTVIGANVTIVDTDFHALDPVIRSSPADSTHALAVPIFVASDVFLGMGSMILKGVHIGQGAVVGAGSVVTKDVPPYTIVGGNPARSLGVVTSPESVAGDVF